MNNRAAAGVDLRREEQNNCAAAAAAAVKHLYSCTRESTLSLPSTTSYTSTNTTTTSAPGSLTALLLHEKRISLSPSTVPQQETNERKLSSISNSSRQAHNEEVEGPKLARSAAITHEQLTNSAKQKATPEAESEWGSEAPCSSSPPLPGSPFHQRDLAITIGRTTNCNSSPCHSPCPARSNSPSAENPQVPLSTAQSLLPSHEQCLIPASLPAQRSAQASPTSSEQLRPCQSYSPITPNSSGCGSEEVGEGEKGLKACEPHDQAKEASPDLQPPSHPRSITLRLCAEAAHRLRRAALSTPKALKKLGISTLKVHNHAHVSAGYAKAIHVSRQISLNAATEERRVRQQAMDKRPSHVQQQQPMHPQQYFFPAGMPAATVPVARAMPPQYQQPQVAMLQQQQNDTPQMLAQGQYQGQVVNYAGVEQQRAAQQRPPPPQYAQPNSMQVRSAQPQPPQQQQPQMIMHHTAAGTSESPLLANLLGNNMNPQQVNQHPAVFHPGQQPIRYQQPHMVVGMGQPQGPGVYGPMQVPYMQQHQGGAPTPYGGGPTQPPIPSQHSAAAAAYMHQQQNPQQQQQNPIAVNQRPGSGAAMVPGMMPMQVMGQSMGNYPGGQVPQHHGPAMVRVNAQHNTQLATPPVVMVDSTDPEADPPKKKKRLTKKEKQKLEAEQKQREMAEQQQREYIMAMTARNQPQDYLGHPMPQQPQLHTPAGLMQQQQQYHMRTLQNPPNATSYPQHLQAAPPQAPQQQYAMPGQQGGFNGERGGSPPSHYPMGNQYQQGASQAPQQPLWRSPSEHKVLDHSMDPQLQLQQSAQQSSSVQSQHYARMRPQPLQQPNQANFPQQAPNSMAAGPNAGPAGGLYLSSQQTPPSIPSQVMYGRAGGRETVYVHHPQQDSSAVSTPTSAGGTPTLHQFSSIQQQQRHMAFIPSQASQQGQQLQHEGSPTHLPQQFPRQAQLQHPQQISQNASQQHHRSFPPAGHLSGGGGGELEYGAEGDSGGDKLADLIPTSGCDEGDFDLDSIEPMRTAPDAHHSTQFMSPHQGNHNKVDEHQQRRMHPQHPQQVPHTFQHYPPAYDPSMSMPGSRLGTDAPIPHAAASISHSNPRLSGSGLAPGGGQRHKLERQARNSSKDSGSFEDLGDEDWDQHSPDNFNPDSPSKITEHQQQNIVNCIDSIMSRVSKEFEGKKGKRALRQASGAAPRGRQRGKGSKNSGSGPTSNPEGMSVKALAITSVTADSSPHSSSSTLTSNTPVSSVAPPAPFTAQSAAPQQLTADPPQQQYFPSKMLGEAGEEGVHPMADGGDSTSSTERSSAELLGVVHEARSDGELPMAPMKFESPIAAEEVDTIGGVGSAKLRPAEHEEEMARTSSDTSAFDYYSRFNGHAGGGEIAGCKAEAAEKPEEDSTLHTSDNQRPPHIQASQSDICPNGPLLDEEQPQPVEKAGKVESGRITLASLLRPTSSSSASTAKQMFHRSHPSQLAACVMTRGEGDADAAVPTFTGSLLNSSSFTGNLLPKPPTSAQFPSDVGKHLTTANETTALQQQPGPASEVTPHNDSDKACEKLAGENAEHGGNRSQAQAFGTSQVSPRVLGTTFAMPPCMNPEKPEIEEPHPQSVDIP